MWNVIVLAAANAAQSAEEKKEILTSHEVHLYGMLGFVLFFLFIAIIFIIFWMKTRGGDLLFDPQYEEAFANEHIKNALADETPIAEAMKAGVKERGVHDASSIPVMTPVAPPPVKQAAPSIATAPKPRLDSGEPDGGELSETFQKLADRLCERLEKAGGLFEVEGPFRENAESPEGLMIRLQGGRTALIIAEWESERFQHRQLRLFDVVFVIRDADHALVIQDVDKFTGKSSNSAP